MGFAGGNNVVLSELLEHSEDYIWLINPDMVSESNTLSNLVRESDVSSIQGARTYDYSTRGKLLHVGACHINTLTGTIRFVKDANMRIDYINGGCMFFSAALLKTIGLLPEKYFLYWEETHWCRLALNEKLILRINENAKVWDKGSTTIGKGKVAEYYYTRNSLLFMQEFFEHSVRINYLMHALRVVLRIFSLRFQRAKGIVLGIRHFTQSKTGKL